MLLILFFLCDYLFVSGFKMVLNFNFYVCGSMFMDNFFFFDKFSALFYLVVFMVSSLVIYYNYVYLNNYFYSLIIIFFVLIMFFLVGSMNFFFIVLWWDLLGLVSFLLIIFYNNYFVMKLSILVMLFNRFGDLLILIVLFVFSSSNSLSSFVLFNNFSFMIFVPCFIMKSSQFPLNLWLTKAMIAPLPVSSLVHSSTLVTVGVYYMFRFSSYIDFFFVEIIVLISLFYYGFLMLFVYDMKKLMALSTMNNLSLMMYFLVINMKMIMFIYMIVHAMFKSMMFLCVGLLIYLNFDVQDIRYGGSVLKFDFLISYFFVLGSLICSGMLFFSMFMCKDMFFDMIFIMKLSSFFFFFFFFFLVYYI